MYPEGGDGILLRATGGGTAPLPSIDVKALGSRRLLVDVLIAVAAFAFHARCDCERQVRRQRPRVSTSISGALVADGAAASRGGLRRSRCSPSSPRRRRPRMASLRAFYPPLGFAVALYTVADDAKKPMQGPRWPLSSPASWFSDASRPGRLAPEVFLGAGVWLRPGSPGTGRGCVVSGWPSQERPGTPSARPSKRERRLAAAEERMRIARDLHDSAGHAINVILVQAVRLACCRSEIRTSPSRAPDRGEVARDTLGEIDQLVRALRDDLPDGEVEPLCVCRCARRPRRAVPRRGLL